MKIKRLFRKFQLPTWNSLYAFGALALSNAILAYSNLSITIKVWVGFFGILLPLFWGFWNTRSPAIRERPLWVRESIPPIPLWLWLLGASLAVFVRFYKLEALNVWPIFDDGLLNYFGYEFFQKGDWHWFYGYSEIVGGFIWIQTIFFKFLSPSLFTFWFIPAFFPSSWCLWVILPPGNSSLKA